HRGVSDKLDCLERPGTDQLQRHRSVLDIDLDFDVMMYLLIKGRVDFETGKDLSDDCVKLIELRSIDQSQQHIPQVQVGVALCNTGCYYRIRAALFAERYACEAGHEDRQGSSSIGSAVIKSFAAIEGHTDVGVLAAAHRKLENLRARDRVRRVRERDLRPRFRRHIGPMV